MKYLLVFLSVFISISTSTILAQPNDQKLEQDPKATQILDKLSVAVQSYKSVSADFLFLLENAQANLKDTLKGTFYLKGDKYKLDMPQMERYFDGEKFVTYTKEANEAMIESPEGVENDINPTEIFTIYKKDFKYRFREETKEEGRNISVIDLYPSKPDEKNFSRIQLKIDKDKNQLFSFQQFNKDGNKTTIKLISFTTKELADNYFVFDKTKHPGVYVEDMR